MTGSGPVITLQVREDDKVSEPYTHGQPSLAEAEPLAAQHHHFVTQDHDLRVLGRLATAQQDQPAEHPDHDQIQQTDRHEARSCPNPSTTPNRRRAARQLGEDQRPGRIQVGPG
jgi:hypothetical protein